jgi:hypothetical protein
MASILVENHSLKPFKQSVLGTYILLESTLSPLALKDKTYKKSPNKRTKILQVPMAWKVPQMAKCSTF